MRPENLPDMLLVWRLYHSSKSLVLDLDHEAEHGRCFGLCVYHQGLFSFVFCKFDPQIFSQIPMVFSLCFEVFAYKSVKASVIKDKERS